MPEVPGVISTEIWDAVRALMLAGVILVTYRTAKQAGEKSGRWIALRNGILICGGLAIFAAATLGSPSCEEQDDPLRGGCERYADDGFDPTSDERLAKLIFWLILLNTPMVIGALDARRYEINPWRRPGKGPDNV